MRRILSALSALLLCLSLAAARGESLSASITVEVLSGGEWQRIPLHLRCAHEDGRLSDGLLMFMPLAEYALYRGEEIPRVRVSEDFACRISTTDAAQSFSCTRVLRRLEGEALTVVEAEELSLRALETGVYLLAWDVSAQRGSESWAGTALAWLVAE